MKLTQEEVENAYFEGVKPDFTGCAFIAAYGDLGDYEESISCFFEKEGKIYEVSSAHCSCNGFDWDPTEVTLQYLEHIVEFKGSEVVEEIKQYLNKVHN